MENSLYRGREVQARASGLRLHEHGTPSCISRFVIVARKRLYFSRGPRGLIAASDCIPGQRPVPEEVLP